MLWFSKKTRKTRMSDTELVETLKALEALEKKLQRKIKLVPKREYEQVKESRKVAP